MRVRNLFALATMVGAGAAAAAAQNCPQIMVNSPSEPVRAGAPVIYSSTVSGGDPNVTPTYNWTISAGIITSGQGTSVINVDTTGVDGSITATVEIGGYDRACGTSSGSTAVVEKSKELRKFAELGKASPEEQNSKLEDFFSELMTDPSATGYIFAYSPKDAPTTAKLFLKKAQAKAAEVQFDQSRLITKEGGIKPAFAVEMWIVPDGAVPPKPNPLAAKPAPNGKKT